MSYVALYRKYRPQNFDEIVGQKAIVTTLKNQLKSGKIAHAYLFCGMRGTGKTSTARVFAKALNCEKGPIENPCNTCASCKAITSGNMMDVIEMDAASNRGIDDIRDLREKVNFAPSEGRYKIYIIDEVHMLTTEAFNALLKTLEEPPKYVIFILATTEPDKLPPTILSRCMRFDFKRITTSEIAERLKKVAQDSEIDVDDKALLQIAAHSQGSVRDALSLLDKAMAFGKGKLAYEDILILLGAVSNEVFYDVSAAVIKGNGTDLLNVVDEVAKQGKDLFRFMDDLLEHFRNLLMVSIGADRSLIDVIDEDYAKLQEISKGYTREKLLSIINVLKDAANDVKWSSQPRIILEAALVKLTLPAFWEKEEGYIARIQQLERQVAALEEQLQNAVKIGCDNTNQSISKSHDAASAKNTLPTDTLVSDGHDLTQKIKKSKDKSESVESVKIDESDKEKADDSKILLRLQEAWPNVLESLGSKRKMTLYSSIKAGGIRPAKIEKNKLYLINDGDAVYEEIILTEKHTIEEIIKQITDIDVTVKGFIVEQDNELPEPSASEELSAALEENDSMADESKAESEEISGEEYGKRVIEFVGEDIVTFKD
ncbi:DNA polymerase III subunit gamma/tau [Tepidanaerobacter acetatoxydans Re1]|uniref:DNA-directed DNA polymerase n=1 Tax=Tepidanaerobacter acetatoxydans (strain DSM 21804 / JCM 16047 / Re1) TaxID=1209989 RepID=F4LSQ9_TEPAE|nr:DNA polymerase III subunit gamma/tau [Tepidanaerobacter acetatoxydans]AEE92449.1 DNA polymerase III, subunits gamma and tau [Tepidanaerobacter acetatoxydans Re1]CDI41014.1 DNA polymerase III subunit gamma/tau [Tepidanaerobacter acetatoxydans Re1]